MSDLHFTLDSMATAAPTIEGVWARDVRPGDWIMVRTKNSLYSLWALSDGSFAASGGWFTAEDAESTPVRVSGCTWGGHAIFTGLVAAPGLFIEFDNGVVTTRVQEVQLIRDGAAQTIH